MRQAGVYPSSQSHLRSIRLECRLVGLLWEALAFKVSCRWRAGKFPLIAWRQYSWGIRAIKLSGREAAIEWLFVGLWVRLNLRKNTGAGLVGFQANGARKPDWILWRSRF